MNPYEGYAQRQNVRRQNVRLLNPEIGTKTRRRQRRASIAIVGFTETGKKTLAYRFGAMNEGPFEEAVPSQYDYLTCIDLDTRQTEGTGDVFLRSYVVPPPENLPREFPPRYFGAIHHFSAIVFICSVVEKGSFDGIVEKIHQLSQGIYIAGLPYFIIVGNKSDLDRRIFPDPLTYPYGLFTTQQHFARNYEECSAKQNINVDIILEEILLQIIAQQP